jgi:1A family penicillin-binding protein
MEESKDQLPPRSREPNKSETGTFFKRVKRTISLMFSLFIITTVALFAFLIYLRAQALPAAVILQTSQIVDIHGDLIDSFHSGQNRQIVRLDDVSPHLVQATLAVEDHRFFDHFGIDIKGLARAALVNLKNREKVQGGSTLTQQLARNLYLNHERTWSRKLKEAVYTLQLEMQYSKEEILEQYLNQIYYGHAAYGIQAAAKMYFAKEAKDLTLAESAMLAGVPKGPKYFSPYMSMENAKAQQKIVLQAMVREQLISQEEADRAYAKELSLMPLVGNSPSKAPYFRDYIRYLAIEQLGLDEELFNEGGIKIYTTLDLKAQEIAEDVIDKHLEEGGELQVALIAIDPRNGYVKAMVGGRDYEENQYNRVFSQTRQPGSAFKPIVYLTALHDSGYSAVTRYKSEPTAFTYDSGRKLYTPSNFGNRYPHDFIDLREAIARSDNIYAVHTIMQTGADNVIEMAQRMGIDSPMKPLPSLALGTYPISPFEMASAFGVIANQGVRAEPTAILRIEGPQGRILYEAQPNLHKVVEPAYTYVLTGLMESVFDHGGTASRVSHLIKRPVAGKTGTTNTDAWMVGFTPELATAVWLGYDRGRTISSTESRRAAPIFAEFTERTLEPIPPKIFELPEGVVSVYINPESGKLATEHCPTSRLESFVKGTEPIEFCSLHGGPAPLEEVEPLEPVQNGSWWQDLKRWWND